MVLIKVFRMCLLRLKFHLWIKCTSFNVWAKYRTHTLRYFTPPPPPPPPPHTLRYFIRLTISELLLSADAFPAGTLRPLRWRHNGRDSVSNHQPHNCLLNRLFGCRSKKISKLRVTGLCVGISPGTGEIPAQMASYAEYVSIWWRHHAKLRSDVMITLSVHWAKSSMCVRCVEKNHGYNLNGR